MQEKLLYKSKLPLLFYICIIIITANILFLAINKMSLEGFLIYPPILGVLLFYTAARFSCKVQVYQKKIIVKYMFFWHQDKTVSLQENFKINVRRNFWSFNFKYENEISREYIFYDTLTITKNDSNTILKINTRFGHLDKIISCLKEIQDMNCPKIY